MINIFYHAALMGDRYDEIILSAFKKIKSSGLYEAADSITMGVLGDGEIELEKSGEYGKVKIVRISSSLEKCERPTMQMLWDHAQENDGEYFYLHTKGVANLCGKHIKDGYYFVEDWRKYMEYFNIERWEFCIKSLKSGYDCVGVNYKEYPWKHFSGGFWWANSEYIRRNERPIDSYPPEGPNRFYDEGWICRSQHIAMNMHSSNVNHYEHPYPEYLYRKIESYGII